MANSELDFEEDFRKKEDLFEIKSILGKGMKSIVYDVRYLTEELERLPEGRRNRSDIDVRSRLSREEQKRFEMARQTITEMMAAVESERSTTKKINTYALKIAAKSTEEGEELRREIEILKRLKGCRYIVKARAAFCFHEELGLLMEVARGGSLMMRLYRETMDEKQTKIMVKQLASALALAHDSLIIHGDIRPENILFWDQDFRIPLLADWGLAHRFSDQNERRYTSRSSIHYAAPEVAVGDAHYLSADMWSLGVTIYVCLEGCLPFYGENEYEVIKWIMQGHYPQLSSTWSSECHDVIHRLFNQDPNQRLTAHQLLNHPWFQTELFK